MYCKNSRDDLNYQQWHAQVCVNTMLSHIQEITKYVDFGIHKGPRVNHLQILMITIYTYECIRIIFLTQEYNEHELHVNKDMDKKSEIYNHHTQ